MIIQFYLTKDALIFWLVVFVDELLFCDVELRGPQLKVDDNCVMSSNNAIDENLFAG